MCIRDRPSTSVRLQETTVPASKPVASSRSFTDVSSLVDTREWSGQAVNLEALQDNEDLCCAPSRLSDPPELCQQDETEFLRARVSQLERQVRELQLSAAEYRAIPPTSQHKPGVTDRPVVCVQPRVAAQARPKNERVLDEGREDTAYTTVFVRNLPFEIDAEKLRDIFLPLGPIHAVKLLMDKDSGQSKGCGFVEFAEHASAKAAVIKIDGMILGGRRIHMEKAARVTCC
eukprot:TRINITY_DN7626_c0_g1_i9.p1 TRINITY_DN7626_c0_g1~~TRINITY_DN7626_c0_g1_i9.p1  ORF type:complete len:231 (-),score=48.51 TRINITY_DN7626_c0_g1_i9:97-789(-)